MASSIDIDFSNPFSIQSSQPTESPVPTIEGDENHPKTPISTIPSLEISDRIQGYQEEAPGSDASSLATSAAQPATADNAEVQEPSPTVTDLRRSKRTRKPPTRLLN